MKNTFFYENVIDDAKTFDPENSEKFTIFSIAENEINENRS